MSKIVAFSLACWAFVFGFALAAVIIETDPAR